MPKETPAQVGSGQLRNAVRTTRHRLPVPPVPRGDAAASGDVGGGLMKGCGSAPHLQQNRGNCSRGFRDRPIDVPGINGKSTATEWFESGSGAHRTSPYPGAPAPLRSRTVRVLRQTSPHLDDIAPRRCSATSSTSARLLDVSEAGRLTRTQNPPSAADVRVAITSQMRDGAGSSLASHAKDVGLEAGAVHSATVHDGPPTTRGLRDGLGCTRPCWSSQLTRLSASKTVGEETIHAN